jgi:hypothetical protein
MYVVLRKINKKKKNENPLFKTMKRGEAQIQGILDPAQANLGFFLLGFSLSSCPQHKLKVLLL